MPYMFWRGHLVVHCLALAGSVVNNMVVVHRTTMELGYIFTTLYALACLEHGAMMTCSTRCNNVPYRLITLGLEARPMHMP